MCGINDCSIKLRGSSDLSDGESPSPATPPKTDPDALVGVPNPFGEADLEPVGVDVEAKREETEALEARYGRVDTEDAKDCESTDPLTFGSLNGEGPVGGSKGEA